MLRVPAGFMSGVLFRSVPSFSRAELQYCSERPPESSKGRNEEKSITECKIEERSGLGTTGARGTLAFCWVDDCRHRSLLQTSTGCTLSANDVHSK